MGDNILRPAAQTDNQAASSANPDTDRQPQWDDEGWDSYLYAVDLNYRVDWDLSRGTPCDEVRAMIDEWEDSHETDDEEMRCL